MAKKENKYKDYGISTQSIHTGTDYDEGTGAVRRPLHMANSYKLPDDLNDAVYPKLFGMFEELVTLLPLIIVFMLSMGLDTMVGLGACLMAACFGFSTAITNLFGISEPGLYGVILQRTETIAALSIGGAISGIIPAVFGTAVYTMGASGIFAMPTYINPDGSTNSLIGAVLTNVVAFVVCFVITFFWPGFDPDKKNA